MLAESVPRPGSFLQTRSGFPHVLPGPRRAFPGPRHAFSLRAASLLTFAVFWSSIAASASARPMLDLYMNKNEVRRLLGECGWGCLFLIFLFYSFYLFYFPRWFVIVVRLCVFLLVFYCSPFVIVLHTSSFHRLLSINECGCCRH